MRCNFLRFLWFGIIVSFMKSLRLFRNVFIEICLWLSGVLGHREHLLAALCIVRTIAFPHSNTRTKGKPERKEHLMYKSFTCVWGHFGSAPFPFYFASFSSLLPFCGSTILVHSFRFLAFRFCHLKSIRFIRYITYSIVLNWLPLGFVLLVHIYPRRRRSTIK